MGTKRYVVRKGFNFRVVDAKNNEKVFSEDDIVTLDQEFGDTCHQLEYADEKDRAAALKAEQEAKKAAPVAPVQSGGIDQAALANAIAEGVAKALAQLQAAATKPADSGTGTGTGS